jgi:hypothetical protein
VHVHTHPGRGNWPLCRRVLPTGRASVRAKLTLPAFMVLFISPQSLNTFQVRYSLFRFFFES